MTKLESYCPACHGLGGFTVIREIGNPYPQALRNEYRSCVACNGTGRVSGRTVDAETELLRAAADPEC